MTAQVVTIFKPPVGELTILQRAVFLHWVSRARLLERQGRITLRICDLPSNKEVMEGFDDH